MTGGESVCGLVGKYQLYSFFTSLFLFIVSYFQWWKVTSFYISHIRTYQERKKIYLELDLFGILK